MAETAFSQEHPYVGVFFFLSMMGVMAFVTFYRFGYISSQMCMVGSTAILAFVAVSSAILIKV